MLKVPTCHPGLHNPDPAVADKGGAEEAGETSDAGGSAAARWLSRPGEAAVGSLYRSKFI